MKEQVLGMIWKIALAASGLAAVGFFVLWSLYQQWLTLPIFSQLTAEQTYALMMAFLVLVFLSFVSGVGAYVFLKLSGFEDNAVPQTRRTTQKKTVK